MTTGLTSILQQVIHKSRYARWNEQYHRREHWDETVARYCNYFHSQMLNSYDKDIGDIDDPATPLGTVFNSIYNLEIMPSMRCLMTAGPALELENLCGYNCNYRPITDTHAFSEIMYALMCGCGVGFSVERQFIGRLPMVPRKLRPCNDVIVVEDSRIGWAIAYQTLIDTLYAGFIPGYNTDKVRAAGTRLKTMGGFASGPGPLVDLFKFTIHTFQQAVDRRLNSLECHDLCCKIGDIVVMGGVRRSALISLSNPSDMRMRHAKMGGWHHTTPWRALSNNSACYTERPTVGAFMTEWLALYDSKSGERGIVNRRALYEKCRAINRRAFWDDNDDNPEYEIELGTNPCAEIILRPMQNCNLSEVVARPWDTSETLRRKAHQAAIVGTWQATQSKFNFMGPDWAKNAEEERLLGVSITGIQDCPVLSNRQELDFAVIYTDMRNMVRETNAKWAKYLGINSAAAATCVKPSGTVSQLVNSSSGIHARFAPYYIRRIIIENHDPLCEFLKDAGLPNEKSVYSPDTNTVFMFPVRAPAETDKPTRLASEQPALEQLENWRSVNNAWADHSVSCTIYVGEDEWPQVGSWVWEHFDEISGLSFLPKSNGVYQQMPFEACSEQDIQALEAKLPQTINWERLAEYEHHDTTKTGHELACVGGACELTS